VDALGGSCSRKGSASLGQSMYTACVHMSLLYIHISMYVCIYIHMQQGRPGGRFGWFLQ